MRLTRKTTDIEAIKAKLATLEDIEEQIGFDLATLLKALLDGVYYSYGEYRNHIKFAYPSLSDLFELSVDDDTTLYLKDYGVTWALTKEELEEEE